MSIVQMPPCDIAGCLRDATRVNGGYSGGDTVALCHTHQLIVTTEIQKDIGQTYRAATGITNDAFTGMLGLPDIVDIQEGEIVEPKPKRKRLSKGAKKDDANL